MLEFLRKDRRRIKMPEKNMIWQDMEGLTYRQAAHGDYDDFYKIKCDPENVKWSGFASAPDYDRMKEWYEKQLNSEMRTIYLCYLDGNICGFFYLDKVSDDEIEAAASGVLSEYSGRGIGTWTVGKRIEIARKSGFSVISSFIADDNPKSWRRFEKLGFEKTGIQEVRWLIGGV